MSVTPDVIGEQRRKFCWCGHTRFVHHNNLGCLARTARTRSGVSLCDCARFDQIPDTDSEETDGDNS